MRGRLLIAALLVAAVVGINISFINNLRNLPYANYYVLLLAINIDLIALIIVTAVILRKLIKVYLGKRRNILRRKLANILFLYLFIPLLLLNVVSIVVVIHSTKAYISSKTIALSTFAERVYRNLYSSELSKVENYRNVLTALLKAGLYEEASRLEGVESVVRVPECDFEVAEGEFSYTLCIDAEGDRYRVVLRKDLGLIRDVSEFGKLALDVRAFVKTRDIITGVFVFFIVFIALITLLATVWLGMLVARHISEPIEKLSDKAMRIAKGNLDVEVEEERTGDEIEELFKSFRRMKENLKEMYSRLQRERDTLEKLLDALPVAVLYISPTERRANRTFLEMFGDVKDPEEVKELIQRNDNYRLEKVKVGEGEIYIVEDVSSIVLAERFRTWQEAVRRIAHEIKNPLTPIRLNLERIARYTEDGKIEPEKFREIVRIILKEIDRISDLVNQFKHLSPRKELRLTEIRISVLIEELRKLYSSAGIRIELEGDRVVKGDYTLLKELFYNLVNNSLEWGAREVRIRVEDGRLEYRDDGAGLRDEDLEKIFIPYYSSNPKGMGLGMAVVKRIVEDHGWRIRALPSEKGARFVIEFGA